MAVQQLQTHVVTKKGFSILQCDSAAKNLFGGVGGKGVLVGQMIPSPFHYREK